MEYSLGIQESLETIFSAVIVGGIDRKNLDLLKSKKEVYKTSMPKFIAKFTSNVFKDEYAFLYEMITTLKTRVFTQNQLETVLYQNEDLVLDSPYIDTDKWSRTIDGRITTDDEKIEAFRLNLVEIFYELSNNIVSEEEFDSACEIYLDWYKDQLMTQTIHNMALIMGDLGFTEKKKGKRSVSYKGLEDAKKYYNEKMSIIRELATEDVLMFESIDEDWLAEELRKEGKEDDGKLMQLGLTEIDETIRYFRRGNMVGILGPTKGGKTKMANYIVGKALMEGLNVAVWALEGDRTEWEAMQTAYLIRKTSGKILDSEMILNRDYPNDDIKQLVIAAKTQMAVDKNRGKLSFISGTAYVEDFIDVLESHYENENRYDIIVIDSLVNIMSRNRRGKSERISEGYMLLKDFITNKLKTKAMAVVPAQLKQEVVDELRKNPNGYIDVTAGGESAETIRSPDYTLGLFSNREERNAGIMKIYSVATRHSGDFDDFSARCELACCNFYSDPELNK